MLYLNNLSYFYISYIQSDVVYQIKYMHCKKKKINTRNNGHTLLQKGKNKKLGDKIIYIIYFYDEGNPHSFGTHCIVLVC